MGTMLGIVFWARDSEGPSRSRPIGVFEVPAAAKGTFAIAEGLAEAAPRDAALGRGDSVAAIENRGLVRRISGPRVMARHACATAHRRAVAHDMSTNQHATLSTKPCPAADAVDEFGTPDATALAWVAIGGLG